MKKFKKLISPSLPEMGNNNEKKNSFNVSNHDVCIYTRKVQRISKKHTSFIT